MKFNNRYVHTPIPGIVVDGPSLTQQEYKRDCDINYIIMKYNQTGILGDPYMPDKMPFYGDFSSIPSFEESQNIVNMAKEEFMNLPSDVRLKFDNNPVKFLDFVSNPANIDECVKLGLMSKPVVETVEPVPLVNAEVVTSAE